MTAITEKELKRLSRTDLLELLLAQSRQIDSLQAELTQVKQQLEDKNIAIRKAGSIAEAALQLNGVFEAAQKACEQYTLNIENMSRRQDQICARMLRDARQAAARPEQDTADWIWELLNSQADTKD